MPAGCGILAETNVCIDEASR